jgi:hypothetical protein
MIKKITSGQEFEKACKDLAELFKDENSKYGHAYLAINPQSVIDSFAHSTMLNSNIYCWANFENGLVDGYDYVYGWYSSILKSKNIFRMFLD